MFTAEFFLSFFLTGPRLSAPVARPANVYQRFSHRWSMNRWHRYLIHPSIIFTRSQKVWFLALSLKNTQLWAAVVWTSSKISFITIFNSVCSDHLTMFPPNLVQTGPRVFKNVIPVLKHPSAADWRISLKHRDWCHHYTPSKTPNQIRPLSLSKSDVSLETNA